MPQFNFKKKQSKIIVETAFMNEIEQLTLSVHQLGGLVVYYGTAGVGKTTTAEWITGRINTAFDHTNPDAFKSVIYQSGKIKDGNEAKKAIRAFYTAVSGTILDEKLYWRSTVEDLADLAVHALQRNRVEITFIDEAGLISVDGLSGLVLISDKARQIGYPLTMVLIGMDNLPDKLNQKHRPQLFRRVHEWCLFQHYDINDTFNLLKSIHTHFASLDPTIPLDWDQVKFIHEITGGLPGFILPFVSRFAAQYESYPYKVDIRLLMAINQRSINSYSGILNQSKNNGKSITEVMETAAAKAKK